jgi:hypothetical protein
MPSPEAGVVVLVVDVVEDVVEDVVGEVVESAPVVDVDEDVLDGPSEPAGPHAASSPARTAPRAIVITACNGRRMLI